MALHGPARRQEKLQLHLLSARPSRYEMVIPVIIPERITSKNKRYPGETEYKGKQNPSENCCKRGMRVKYKQPYVTQSEGGVPGVSGLDDITSKRQPRTRTIFSSPLWVLFLIVIIGVSPNSCSAAFLPRSRVDLKGAVNACLKLFPKKGVCSSSLHGPIGQWDVSRVTDMSGMFSNANLFRGDISKWHVSNVKDMSGMFRDAKSFNGDISTWDVSSVSNMDSMFRGAILFERKLCGAAWVHSSARKTSMFAGSPGSISRTVCTTTSGAFSPESKEDLKGAVEAYLKWSSKGESWLSSSGSPHGPIEEWDVSRVTDMSGMFYEAHSFNGDISKWDVSSVIHMDGMFSGARSFNGDISKWDVSRVTHMNGMFVGARAFIGDISKWDVSRVTGMFAMFDNAVAFNGDISKWDVSQVKDMAGMFMDANAFSGDISKWDVSRVAQMTNMFHNAAAFNGDLSKWDVSSVKNMNRVFKKAAAFNGDLSKWDVSSVKNMNGMFWGAALFNSDISKWDVSSVTDMGYMLSGAKSFNGDISKWDVSSVTDTSLMFSNSELFDRDLSNWDVSRVTSMNRMFWQATSFNQKLCGTSWLHSKATKSGMFERSPGSISRTMCTTTNSAFTPESKVELRSAVDYYRTYCKTTKGIHDD